MADPRLPRDGADALRQLCEIELRTRESRKDPEQIRDIVPWERFVSDEYYSGAFAPMLYDYWKREIGDFLESGLSEWVITGSLGGGKSTAGIALLFYEAYTLTNYKYPQRLFGLGDIADTVFAILGPGGATNDESFVRLLRAFDSSAYFREHCPRNMDRSSIIEIPSHRMRIAYGSGRTRGSAVLSTDLLFVMLDEANFYKLAGTSITGDVGMARHAYTATGRRRRSRYVTSGRDPSKSLLISSVDHDASFTEQRIAEAEKVSEQIKVTFTNPWLTKPAGTYSTQTFFVFKGTEEQKPQVISEPLDVAHILGRGMADTTELYAVASVEGASVKSVVESLTLDKRRLFVEVPIDFEKDFVVDVEGALKDISGVSVRRVGRLFTSHALWRAATMRVPELRHPFSRDSFPLGRDSGALGLEDYFTPDVLFNEDGRFRRQPYAPRFVHVDSSETECPTGITMCHQAGVVEDSVTRMALPVVEIDFVLRIEPPEAPDKISHTKILKFWLWLHKAYDFRYGSITYDMYASNMPLEVLDAHRITSGRYAAAGDYGAWKDYVRLYEEGRIQFYHYEPLRSELFDLVDDRAQQKVLNPSNWKDLCDSQVGAVTACLKAASYGPAMTLDERMDQKVLVIRRGDETDPVRCETEWVLADYRGRSAKEGHRGERHGVDVQKLDIDGELGKA